MKLSSSSSFVHHYTVTLLGKLVHFLNDVAERDFLGWCKWFFWTIEEEREKTRVWRKMFGWITHCSLTAILNYVDKILVFKTKYEKKLNYVYKILHNSKFKIQKFKI